MKNIIVYSLSIILLIGVGAIYGIVGYGIAWILDVAIDVNVNYNVFVGVAIGIFLIKVISNLFFKLYAKKKIKEMNDESDSFF